MPIDNPADRRKFGRRSVFKPAVIVHGDGTRLPATVIDLSEGGARIKIGQPELVEPNFSLEIQEDDFVVQCQLVRREESAIGAQFTRAPRRLSWIKRRR